MSTATAQLANGPGPPAELSSPSARRHRRLHLHLINNNNKSKQQARSQLANNLTLTIVLVALFASFAIAASSASWSREKRSDETRGQRLVSRLDNLNDRVVLNDFNEQVVSDESAANDEEFLRQLKVAAQFLGAKLANEQRQRQEATVELSEPGEGALPRYGLLTGQANDDERPPVVVEGADERFQYALPADLSPAPSSPSSSSSYNSDRPLEAQQLANDDDNDNNDDETNARANLINYLLDKAHESQRTGPPEVDDEAKTVSSSDNHNARKRNQAIKMTTLLEDEEPAAVESAQPEAAALMAAADGTTTTTASYGKLVERPAALVADESGAPVDHREASQPAASLMGTMLSNLGHYLPFLNQIKLLRGNEQAAAAPAVSERPINKTRDANVDDDHDDKLKRDGLREPAKQSVSANRAISVSAKHNNKNNNKLIGNEQHNDESEHQANDDKSKLLRLKVNVAKDVDDENNNNDGFDQADLVVPMGQEAETKDVNAKVRVSTTNKRLSVAIGDDDHELDQMIEAEQQQQQMVPAEAAYNMMRQSNLVLSGDQAGKPADSLLGKYIYAPTQHYYLNAVPTPGAAVHSATGGHSGGSLANQLKPAYAFQKDPASMFGFVSTMFDPTAAAAANNNKRIPLDGSGGGSPNDLYFLVMVGAFCVMAMAVVLAAGLFAYRVQQQRKSSQDTDYPTYGVVGPNNLSGGGVINGKAGGAAAFVGGYFSSPLSGSKAGSARHLPDLYRGTIDSGLGGAGGDKLSSGGSSGGSSKKSSSSTISSGGVPGGEPARNGNVGGGSGGGRNGAASAVAAATAAANQDAARMYHYQHQKQQMLISDRSSAGRHTSASDLDSDDEDNDDGSYTVYECPGLASAHEMEIKNPLFNDDQSP